MLPIDNLSQLKTIVWCQDKNNKMVLLLKRHHSTATPNLNPAPSTKAFRNKSKIRYPRSLPTLSSTSIMTRESQLIQTPPVICRLRYYPLLIRPMQGIIMRLKTIIRSLQKHPTHVFQSNLTQ